MEVVKKPSYKYCMVPECKNTTISTPDKIFFRIPRDAKLRTNWCKMMGRDNAAPLSVLFCCEDHFNIEQDMENYIKYKLVGGMLKLKKGVVPHKFDCQKTPKKTIERGAFKKRREIEFFERVLSKDICHEDLQKRPIELIECEYKDPAESNQENDVTDITNPTKSEIMDPIDPTDCAKTEPVEYEQSKNTMDLSDNNLDDPFASVDLPMEYNIPVVKVEVQKVKSKSTQVKMDVKSRATNTPSEWGKKLNKRKKCVCRCYCGGK